MQFKLSKYILPSVISMVLVGTYTNIDGFFIGNVTGDDGLAAINIVWPIVALITAIGTGIGVGGSVLLNKLRGAHNRIGAAEVRSTLLFLLFAVGILTGGLLLLCYKPLLVWMGAAGTVYDYAADYALIVCIGSVFQIAGAGLVALLRNEQKTYFSMVCCIVGLVVHLVLDWLLVERYTLGGVALSTVLSQAVIMVLCLIALRSPERAKMNKRYIGPILIASTSPLGINFVPSVVLLFTNYFALEAGGTAAVSAYAVMSYAVYTFDYVFQGVCDGIQPVVSYCCGANDQQEERRAIRVGAWVLGVSVAVFMALTPALIAVMPKVFATSGTAEEMMKSGFIIYAFSYPFKAAVKFIGSYYYAVGKTTISNLLIYADPVVFTPLFLAVLSKAWGMDGIWWSMTFAQVAVTILGTISFLHKKRVR